MNDGGVAVAAALAAPAGVYNVVDDEPLTKRAYAAALAEAAGVVALSRCIGSSGLSDGPQDHLTHPLAAGQQSAL